MNGHSTPSERHERMTAPELAAALAERAEDVCRRYLPGGRKEGRYWKAGNVRGGPGRSLFVGLAPSPRPGRWKDAATGERGDPSQDCGRAACASFDESRSAGIVTVLPLGLLDRSCIRAALRAPRARRAPRVLL